MCFNLIPSFNLWPHEKLVKTVIPFTHFSHWEPSFNYMNHCQTYGYHKRLLTWFGSYIYVCVISKNVKEAFITYLLIDPHLNFSHGNISQTLE